MSAARTRPTVATEQVLHTQRLPARPPARRRRRDDSDLVVTTEWFPPRAIVLQTHACVGSLVVTNGSTRTHRDRVGTVFLPRSLIERTCINVVVVAATACTSEDNARVITINYTVFVDDIVRTYDTRHGTARGHVGLIAYRRKGDPRVISRKNIRVRDEYSPTPLCDIFKYSIGLIFCFIIIILCFANSFVRVKSL